ncbi:hypothetical protein PLICRDRAFT_36261 [Plicaturopsis crispa FD-325 SS-3]|nr:hypothetical protein PLICRDRAFT_36261 [Plicaturopsis crispa FD-325 SS-3]
MPAGLDDLGLMYAAPGTARKDTNGHKATRDVSASADTAVHHEAPSFRRRRTIPVSRTATPLAVPRSIGSPSITQKLPTHPPSTPNRHNQEQTRTVDRSLLHAALNELRRRDEELWAKWPKEYEGFPPGSGSSSNGCTLGDNPRGTPSAIAQCAPSSTVHQPQPECPIRISKFNSQERIGTGKS